MYIRLANYTPQVPNMSQVCIYPKEAAAVTGNGYQAGKRLLQRIRKHFDKPARAYVSVTEFCQFTHLPEVSRPARALHQAPGK